MPKKNLHTNNEEIDFEAKLRLPRNEFLEKLIDKIESIQKLEGQTRESMEYKMWRRETETLLLHAFGAKSKQYHDFNSISYYPPIISFSPYDNNMDDYHQFYLAGLQTARECLLSIASEVKEYYCDSDSAACLTAGGQNSIGVQNTRRVFVVHGHDVGVKETVSRFLSKLDFEPIILHEQPNGGKTLIEKFETNAYDVSFAVVIVTPDDVGRAKSETDLKPRARQNVILELGYFMGKLGRSRVCALCSENIEEPSDVTGVVYIPLDASGGWKIQLCRELQAAGLTVDAQKILTA